MYNAGSYVLYVMYVCMYVRAYVCMTLRAVKQPTVGPACHTGRPLWGRFISFRFVSFRDHVRLSLIQTASASQQTQNNLASWCGTARSPNETVSLRSLGSDQNSQIRSNVTSACAGRLRELWYILIGAPRRGAAPLGRKPRGLRQPTAWCVI